MKGTMTGEKHPPDPPALPPESVLAVDRARLIDAGVLPQGFSADGWEKLLQVVAEEGAFSPRSELEEDPSRKQVIPYAVVTFRERVFLLRRTKRGGEARLHR